MWKKHLLELSRSGNISVSERKFLEQVSLKLKNARDCALGRSSKSGNHPGTDGAFDQNYIGTLEQVFEEDNNQRARQASSSSSMSDVERDGVDAEAVVDEGDDGEWETVGKGGKPLKKIEIKSAGVELRGFWVDSPGFELVSRLAFA